MNSKLATLTVSLVLAAVPLAGCGSSSSGGGSASPADARSAYAPVKTELSGLGDAIGNAVGGAAKQTDAALATQFGALATRGHAMVASLNALKLPSSLTTSAHALSDAVASGTSDLTAISSASKAHDKAAVSTAARKLFADSEKIASTRKTFEQQLAAAK